MTARRFSDPAHDVGGEAADDRVGVLRLLVRALAFTPGFLVVLVAGPAPAAPPEGWPEPDPVSTLQVLLILVGIPLALFVVIAFAVYVPSMTRGERYTPGLAWRNENEWFGGPRAGIEAADRIDPKALEVGSEPHRGGASARW